ncbi:hypothetical protein IFM89_018809 [Coptis chinensis]|uniref:WRC domain-containing protein n=1 Tax=Coptis chinensis TaxID=261450 RepID=A0A835H1M8_9MAGN|nr:hypothetical protein IFM89_018809 [Coptis chinensis]
MMKRTTEKRCIRNDGKGWQCKGLKFEGNDYCEKHYLQRLPKREKEKKKVGKMVKRREEINGVEEEDEGVRKRVKRSQETDGVQLEKEEEGVGVSKKEIEAILRDSEIERRDKYTISELVFSLKTAFRFKEFEEVAQILQMREKKMKVEKEEAEKRCCKLLNEFEEKKKELVAVKEMLQDIELRKISLEDEVWGYRKTCDELKEKVTRLEEDHKVVCERERRSEERVITLSDELKKMNKREREIMFVLKNENRDLECAKRQAENEIEVWKKRFNELKTNCVLKTESLPQLKIKEEVAKCDLKRRAGNEIEVSKKRFKEQETNCGSENAGFPQVKVKDEALNCDRKVYASAIVDFARPSLAKAGGVAQFAEERKKSESAQRVIPSEVTGAPEGASLSVVKIKKEDGISKFLSEFRKLKGNK